MDKIEELLTRGVANIIPSEEKLKELLRNNKKLNIYLGIDPTSPHIHLGNAVQLRILQALANLDHNITFLIGDFTALIGDTSDKDSERPVLTSEQIQENFKTYKTQAEKILDFNKIQIKYNSEWLKELSFAKIVKLCQHFSVGDFIGRELIKRRLTDGKRIGLHEILYPVMQGYDSYHLDTDLQVGGTDQTFNMQAGRILQKDLRSKESFILATEFLMGTDGRKMSKTWDNAIWLDDNPRDMYAKVMAITDDLITQYYMLATQMPMDEIEEIKAKLESGKNPMIIKKDLACKIVTELHSKEDANHAAQNFEKTVQQKEVPSDILEIKVKKETTVGDVLIENQLIESKSQLKRLLEQKGISVDNKIISDWNLKIAPGSIIKIGKRRFIKISTH